MKDRPKKEDCFDYDRDGNKFFDLWDYSDEQDKYIDHLEAELKEEREFVKWVFRLHWVENQIGDTVDESELRQQFKEEKNRNFTSEP